MEKKAMTVKNLIAFLQTCPQDAEVLTSGENGWENIYEGDSEYHEKVDINIWGYEPIYVHNVVLL